MNQSILIKIFLCLYFILIKVIYIQVLFSVVLPGLKNLHGLHQVCTGLPSEVSLMILLRDDHYWCTEKPHSMVHWVSNYGPVPHHLHERHREPDEDSRQDQGEEDQQPGLGRRQHPQGQHGGGGGGRAGARPGPNRYALCASAS